MSIQAAFIVPHPPLIVPEVGHGKEVGIQATIDAYDKIAQEIAQLKPETIIISSPHATSYRDYFHISPGTHAHGDLANFGAHHSRIDCIYDAALASHISELAAQEEFPAGTDYERDPKLDHATYIPLYFVNKYYQDYEVVRIGLSGLDSVGHYHMGELIAQAVNDLGRNAVYIASGDLSHKLKDDGPYGFAPEGPVFDKEITQAMRYGDFMRFLSFDEGFCDKAAECGLRSFQMMTGALDGKAVEAELLSYEGPFGVGYACAMFHVKNNDKTRHIARIYKENQREKILLGRAGEDAYVSLARASVEHFVHNQTPLPIPTDLPDDLLSQRAGVFVSLHEHGRLRGCIGTISPVTSNIAEEIIRNGISACSEDPRFDPIRSDELDQLEISVDVLGEPESIDSEAELDPRRYGVIVTNGVRRGLLLPMLDGVDTVEEQISIAKRKAGIADEEPGTSLQRFEVVRHEAGETRSSGE